MPHKVLNQVSAFNIAVPRAFSLCLEFKSQADPVPVSLGLRGLSQANCHRQKKIGHLKGRNKMGQFFLFERIEPQPAFSATMSSYFFFLSRAAAAAK